MKERFLKIITSEGLTQTLLADEIGIQRSTISHILTGRSGPSVDVLQKLLARFPKLNAEWLILGQGSMYKSSVAEVPDLFAASAPVEKTPASPTTIPEEPQNLSSGEDDPEKLIGTWPEISPPSNPKKTIEKIVILYTDKTFATYFPEAD